MFSGDADATRFNLSLGASKKVIDATVDGAKVVDLCALGDRTIEELAGKVYNKGKMLKGEASAYVRLYISNNVVRS